MKNSNTFYKRYITEIETGQAIDGAYPLKGTSPFGEGTIHIKEDGTFKCQVTGAEGKPEDFLGQLYPLLTQAGIKRAIDAESHDDQELRKHICESRLSSFRGDPERLEELERISGLPKSIAHEAPLWLDQDGVTLHYFWRSETGHPLAQFSWQHGQRRETIIGVPRLEPFTEANRIWFVENPLQAVVLQCLVKEPVLIRPHDNGLDWIDYKQLLCDKTAVLLIGDERGEWAYSFHPFIKYLQNKNVSFKSLSTMPLTQGKLLTMWLQENPSAEATLLEAVKGESANQTVAFNQATYQKFISNDGRESLYFPQDTKGGMFWYGTAEGELVHSHPFNILASEEIGSNYNLDVTIHQDPDIRLTKSDVFNIDRSARQMTPKNTFRSLRSLIGDHIYLQHPETASLIALWIMGGYVYKLFNAYGYLHINGSKGTGKTTLLELISRCGFNGVLESQSTKASVVQQVHKLGCTLCLDEFESHSKGTGTEYTHMINVGYKEGGSYRKMMGKSSTSYNLYSPKAIASIDPIEAEALNSRIIPIPMSKIPPHKDLQLWEPDSAEIQQRMKLIRRECYALGLYHHKEIHKYYRRIPSRLKLPSGGTLNGRKRQLVAPLLSMARLVDINGPQLAEQELLKAVELAWHPKLEQQQVREKLLADLLQQWSSSPEFVNKKEFREYKGQIAINNECWKSTELAAELGGKDAILTWLLTRWNLKKQAVHMSHFETNKSCTLFPEDLNIAGKEFREWFSRE